MEVEYHLPYKLIIIIGICLSFFCGIANIRQDSVHLLILVVLYDCHPDYQQVLVLLHIYDILKGNNKRLKIRESQAS